MVKKSGTNSQLLETQPWVTTHELHVVASMERALQQNYLTSIRQKATEHTGEGHITFQKPEIAVTPPRRQGGRPVIERRLLRAGLRVPAGW